MGTPLPIQEANLGMADSLILMVLALVVFGPRRLPQIGRQIGKLMFEFRKASNDFKFQMEEELRLSEEAERRKKLEAERKQVAQESVAATPAVASTVEPTATSESSYPPASGLGVTSPAEEARPDDEVPRILPPSTGETVAARRNPEVPEAAAAAQPAEPAVEPAVHENAPDREAVSPNG
jgi:sec-independent protein translocase protein TatB